MPFTKEIMWLSYSTVRIINHYLNENDIYKKCEIGKELNNRNIILKLDIIENILIIQSKKETYKFFVPFSYNKNFECIEYDWEEILPEILDEVGITASSEQIDKLSSLINDNSLVELDYCGSTEQHKINRDEIDNLKKELEIEKSKKFCKECQGTGFVTEFWFDRFVTSDCNICHGKGKI